VRNEIGNGDFWAFFGFLAILPKVDHFFSNLKKNKKTIAQRIAETANRRRSE
jgi:hypothetical protein